jgi:Spy/CpxP family protein refolding chaperone
MANTTASRARIILLVLSLCFNVALIAMLVVGMGRSGGRFFAGPGVMAPGQIARGLPSQQREKILDLVAEHREAMRDRRRAARRARLEALRVLDAPDYALADFGRALDDVRAADAALEEESVSLQREMVDTLTPAQRKIVAERIRARRAGPWWRRARAHNANP